ncbi:MAG: YciI family protein [Methylosarcina sp.]
MPTMPICVLDWDEINRPVLHRNGHCPGASLLQPVATATSVKIREGRRLITDGPFAETHERLWGYFLVEPKIPMRRLLLRAAFPLL